MFCSKCGAQNPDNVQSCSQCGEMLTAATQPAVVVVPAKTSSAAIASLVMGLLGLIVCPLAPILFIPSLICGIVGLVKISNSNGKLKGNGLAIAGLILSGFMLFALPILLAILMPALNKVKHISQRVVCGTNIKGLGTAIMVYSNDYDDMPPTSEKWCDLLIAECDVSLKSFVCPDSDAVEGESCYAMNIHAAGKNLGELPADMVLLFEADTSQLSLGQKPWNLAGGKNMLTTQNHNGEGCNVGFVDGHTEFVTEQDIPNLRWMAEDK